MADVILSGATTDAAAYNASQISGVITGANTTPTDVTTTLSNATTTPGGPPPPLYGLVWQQVLISMVLGVMIIGTVIGNSLVCIAVAIVKKLQTPSNLLIVSLALSDLLVAALVMPLGAVYEVLGYWAFNDLVCDLWTSLDVIMCTASILNLCTISIDRYFVITRPFQYAVKRTPVRMAMMIAAVWCLSAVISIPPLFGWAAERQPYQCSISQDIGYQIYATLGAFYVPLSIMIFIYFRIWRVSARIMKSEKSSKMGSMDRGNEQIHLSNKSSRSSGASDNLHLPNGTMKNGYNDMDDASTEMLSKKSAPPKRRFTLKSLVSRTSRSSSTKSAASKDAKATKTLGVIMGGFTLCWLPFFILAVIRPFLSPSAPEGQEMDAPPTIPPWLTSTLMWLGYFNSFLNPLIYARFNRDFRTPFKEILCFRCVGINVRLRSESYIDQYGPDQIYRDRDRDSLRPPADSIVRYNSQGHTHVQIGNGNSRNVGESKI